MSKFWKHGKKVCGCVSSGLLLFQLGGTCYVRAEEPEYDGTTQLKTIGYYLDVDTLAVSLKVEEVCVEAGSQVSRGDTLLKLTEDSCREAEDYYAAAILRAEGNLTDTQLQYDQGVLEAEYKLEEAKAQADLAEQVKEYQTKELADTIADHEGVLEEIEERIAELEDGIAAGSYGSGSGSSGNGSLGGGSFSGGSGGDSPSKDQEGKDQTEAPETENKPAEGETEVPETDQTEPQETLPTENTDEQKQTETSGSEGETNETENSQTESAGGETETDPDEKSEQEMKEAAESLKTQISVKEEEYRFVLAELAALGTDSSEDTDADPEENTEGEKTADSMLQESIDGSSNVKANLENVQKNLSNVPEAVLNVVKETYKNYEEYVKLLDSCISQLNSDIEAQKKVKESLTLQQEAGGKDFDEAAYKELIGKLEQVEGEKTELYGQLFSLQEKWIELLGKSWNSLNRQKQSRRNRERIRTKQDSRERTRVKRVSRERTRAKQDSRDRASRAQRCPPSVREESGSRPQYRCPEASLVPEMHQAVFSREKPPCPGLPTPSVPEAVFRKMISAFLAIRMT